MVLIKQGRHGFTIVELLIVVVVIAILAAITIVAYNGIQNQAKLSALKSALSSAGRAAEVFKAQSDTESYPTSLNEANIPQSDTIFLQISANNTVSPKTFCITAVDRSKPGVAYRIAHTGGVQNGQCPGHTTNPGFTNIATNSNFDNVGSSYVTARTNLFINPRQVATGSMGSGLVSVSGQTGYGGITTAGEGIADSAWKSFYLNGTFPYSGTATPVAMRFWVKTNQSTWTIQNLSSNINIIGAWGGVLTRLDTNQVVSDFIADNVAREYSLRFTIPASQTTAWSFGFKHGSATPAASKKIAVTGLLGELGSSAGTYFDGDTTSSVGLDYNWTGASSQTASTQQGSAVGGVSSNRLVSTRSSAWSSNGSYSMLQTPNNTASSDSYTDLLGGASAMIPTASLQPSTQYTLMATVRLEAPLTGALQGATRSIFVHLNGTGIQLNGTSQAPNAAGVYDLRATFTTPATLAGYNTIRLYHGGMAGSGVLWWDSVALVQGDYTGSYFE